MYLQIVPWLPALTFAPSTLSTACRTCRCGLHGPCVSCSRHVSHCTSRSIRPRAAMTRNPMS